MTSIRFWRALASWKLPCCLLTGAVLLGCAEQSEGERCDPRNDNRDCESGLLCTSLRSLNRGTQGAVCCPGRTGSTTVDICRQGNLEFPEDSDPTETSPTETEAPTDETEPPDPEDTEESEVPETPLDSAAPPSSGDAAAAEGGSVPAP